MGIVIRGEAERERERERERELLYGRWSKIAILNPSERGTKKMGRAVGEREIGDLLRTNGAKEVCEKEMGKKE